MLLILYTQLVIHSHIGIPKIIVDDICLSQCILQYLLIIALTALLLPQHGDEIDCHNLFLGEFAAAGIDPADERIYLCFGIVNSFVGIFVHFDPRHELPGLIIIVINLLLDLHDVLSDKSVINVRYEFTARFIFIFFDQQLINNGKHFLLMERIQLLIIQLLKTFDRFVIFDKFDILIRILRKFYHMSTVTTDLISTQIVFGEQLDEVIVAQHLTRIVQHKFMQSL